ncbi:MAG: hypothetical protein ACPGO3_00880 [Magnetospiraceae bacterium]
MSAPKLKDYMALFELYGGDPGNLYLEPDDQRFRFLFEQVVRLLAQPCPFNHSLPYPFIDSARRYVNGDPETVRHLGYPENQHFMLSDLYDYLALRARSRSSKTIRP